MVLNDTVILMICNHMIHCCQVHHILKQLLIILLSVPSPCQKKRACCLLRNFLRPLHEYSCNLFAKLQLNGLPCTNICNTAPKDHIRHIFSISFTGKVPGHIFMNGLLSRGSVKLRSCCKSPFLRLLISLFRIGTLPCALCRF